MVAMAPALASRSLAGAFLPLGEILAFRAPFPA